MAVNHEKGQVYFIETGDGQFVKIGYSTQVLVRLSELGTLRPGSFALRVIGSIPGSQAIERWLHLQFADERDNGEWFRRTPRLSAFIESLGLTPPVMIERPVRRRKVPKRRPIRVEQEAEPESEPEAEAAAPIVEWPPEPVQPDPKLPPHLTPPEKDKFFKAITNIRDMAIFRLLYHHGLRAGEIGKLQLSDYRQGPSLDLDQIYIHRLKGSISGECAVVPTAAFAVRAWLRKRGSVEGPLFLSRQRGRITRARVWQLMQDYGKLAGLPAEKRHPHILKHTCATHLINDKKESIIDVQKHLGHANIANTRIYALPSSEANEAQARRLKGWK